jgi:F-type H+-transporting ATPase subunit gamma
MDALDSLHRKIESAKDLKSVVRTMKAMAASNIGQYQMAVSSLGDYYHTVVLALVAYLNQKNVAGPAEKKELKGKEACRTV